MYGAPCPLCGGAGLLRIGSLRIRRLGAFLCASPLPCTETGAVWRLSRCSLVLCFSLEVTRACADARWVSGVGGVSFTS